MFRKLLFLSVAGACGTVGRYMICELAQRVGRSAFPLGTFAVNILGSFLFGLVYVVAERRLNLSGEMRLIVLTGFMGAFTTFSTFAFDTAKLLRSAEWTLAIGNVFGHIILGIAALVIGVLVGRTI